MTPPKRTNERNERPIQGGWTRGGTLMAADASTAHLACRTRLHRRAHVFVGAPKLGKSWLPHDLALAVPPAARCSATGRGPPRPASRPRGLRSSPAVPAHRDSVTATAATLADWHYLTRLPADRSPDQSSPTGSTASPHWTRPRSSSSTRSAGPKRPSPPSSPRTTTTTASVSPSRTSPTPSTACALVVVHHDRKAESADFVD